jgi:hypothetical protein
MTARCGCGFPAVATPGWGQEMQQVFALVVTASGDLVIGGARGFLARRSAAGFAPVALPVTAHVTGLVEAAEGEVHVCGHSPTSFVATLSPDGAVRMLYEAQGGPLIRAPQLHDGVLHLAAPGPDGGVFALVGDRLERIPIPGDHGLGEIWHLEAYISSHSGTSGLRIQRTYFVDHSSSGYK